ncbi:MAG: hypothetical protein LIP10_03555 [Clostridiales bacterium]|nr:hypothetical protein [Clostridiales bacterium]
MAEFELGRTVMTNEVCYRRITDKDFDYFMTNSLKKYQKQDWGDICEEDKELNDAAVRDGEQIVALYKYSDDVSIYIITESDRSVTTICFPYER